MGVQRVKLNYIPTVSEIPPVRTVPVSSSHMEELNRSIRQKVKQNEAERAASIEAAGRYTVR